ncbi:Putative multidrug export ATP-binding/permease protein SAV1866 [Acholeplasma oculi]|uniref:ABC transporter, ATP-binding/permease protein n=1 Tax=Acholeplasma oculi TaxID=35623 RepID=A0A061A9N1_9MOLU|nr:ABC transporter ATP-binding protein [Acholeplasma oculi]CDR30610.1 ABC transporter, ATP-binding/permease protein [Acholeplasma oculi]SKC46383.1 ATP-binding cassette, subfamily B [Acholeplasma oculi]SUT89333.1 Putative multidrug export ATP-binding/permease protein SAV1866 [Acholeplasma oculi]
MIKSFRYLKPYIFWVITIFVLVAIRALMNLALPYFLGVLINDMVSQSLTDADKYQSLLNNGLLMLGTTVLGILVILISGYLESKVSSAYARDLREALYKKVQQFSMNEVDTFTTSSLITRTTNDIQSLQMMVAQLLRSVVMAPFMAIGGFVMAFVSSPDLSVFLVFSVVIVILFLTILIFIAMPKFKLIQKLVDKMNLVTRENLSGLRVVRAFNTQEVQAKKSKEVAKEAMERNIFVNRLFNTMWPVMGLVMQLTTVMLYFVALNLNIIGPGSAFEPGNLSAIIQYGTQTLMNFMFITMILTMIPRASISAKRIMEVIDKDIQIQDPIDYLEISDFEGEVTFDHVTFQYPDSDEPVLNDISFVAKKGQMTAIIGSTGSGKSTLINLLPRFYDPTGGSILIDGVDIKKYRQNDFLKYIGYVPQKGNLFKGTIESNIAFGQDTIDEEVIKKSASIAQASEFIEKLDEGFKSPINQGGSNVSGGQRQRLSIARAIAKNPKIMIFDDSFSALDYRTDQKLRQALKEEIDATILVVAQRINTIKNADQIIVLDKGKIAGIGTHDELLKSCEVYIEIAESQLSKEELSR